MDNAPLILLAAGGTGGHLFPAEALGVELIRRGVSVRLATDARALRYSGLFSRDNIDVVPSETMRSRNPLSLARTVLMLGYGTAVAAKLVRRLKPAAVVGFGGYPTVPPLLAARLLGVPGIIHDANAVLGRANRFLSRHVLFAHLLCQHQATPKRRLELFDRGRHDVAHHPRALAAADDEQAQRPVHLRRRKRHRGGGKNGGAHRRADGGGLAGEIRIAIEHAGQRGCDRADAA